MVLKSYECDLNDVFAQQAYIVTACCVVYNVCSTQYDCTCSNLARSCVTEVRITSLFGSLRSLPISKLA